MWTVVGCCRRHYHPVAVRWLSVWKGLKLGFWLSWTVTETGMVEVMRLPNEWLVRAGDYGGRPPL